MKKNTSLLVTKKHQKPSLFSGIIVVILAIYSLLLVSLILWGFISSFKTRQDYAIHPFGLPTKWVFTNYINAFQKFTINADVPFIGKGEVTVPLMFLFGLLYALGCSIAATVVPCFVGYATAKYNYKFSKIIYYIVIVCMILPIIGNLPAEITMAKKLGFYGQIWGTWLMKANFLGLYFIIFYNFFKNLPNAYNEAARIDGAGNFRIFFKVILPMAIPLFSTVLLLNFITFWNDYQTPYIYLAGRYPTISYGMFVIATDGQPQYADPMFKFASSFLVLIPVLILFLVFNKRLLGNLTMGGIKG